jgi:hypothetical protein
MKADEDRKERYRADVAVVDADHREVLLLLVTASDRRHASLWVTQRRADRRRASARAGSTSCATS